jgi:NADP-dependent 3-hydroxy acid dehydrogenase YdfG
MDSTLEMDLESLSKALKGRTIEGHRVLITGVTAGIGLATAMALVQEGAIVYGTGRRKDRLDALAAHFARETSRQDSASPSPGQFIPVLADATDSGVFNLLGRAGALECDVLIANAGLAKNTNPVSLLEPLDAAEMISTNLTATIMLIREVLPKMVRRGGGQIIGVGSIAAHQPYENGNVYCATKAALRSFFQCMRQETCGQNVRVNLISPGLVETEFSMVRFSGNQAKASAVYSGLTPLSAADIAREIVHIIKVPGHVNIDDMVITPTRQGSVYRIARENASI